MAWRIALLVVWVAALLGLAAISHDQGLEYIVGGLVITIAVGALVDRWWVGIVPFVTTLLLVGSIFILIGGCDGECGGDDGFGPIVLWFLLVFTAPATIALLLGVAGRRIATSSDSSE
jgi:hypothetical protein